MNRTNRMPEIIDDPFGLSTAGASKVPGYLDLKALAAYSCCPVRWLRDRLVDQLRPLPHYRIEGKILVKREEFEHWLSASRITSPADRLDVIVDSVIAHVRPSKQVA